VLGLVFGFLSFVLGLLPAFTAPDIANPGSDYGVVANNIGAAIRPWSGWIPVGLAIKLLAAAVLILGAQLAGRAVLWVYDKIPGKGT